ncbi:hypothetical protein [Desulfolutivibrio sp.]|uniref:hypothetical protein n=1 Tax=Desulfolutivibrio sp. TaxID=2773296 RepID=UPI002F969DCD
MRKNMMVVVLLIGFLALAGLAAAQDSPGAAPGAQAPKPAATGQAPAGATKSAVKEPAAAPSGGQKAGKASHPVQGSPAVTATEQRYQEYLDREKNASDAALAKQRGKLEDKYKGFVRTVKPKQGSKGDAKKGGQ